MLKRKIICIAILLALLLAVPALAAPAARFQALYWPAFEENVYALSPGGGWGDYLALAAMGNVLAFIRRDQADNPACTLSLYDLAHARALASLPLRNEGWGDHWLLGFWAPGCPYTLEEGSLTLTVYDQTLKESLRFTPPAGYDLAYADPAGQALWCSRFYARSLTRFSLPGGQATEVTVPLPEGWAFTGFAGAWRDGILSVFSNSAGQSAFFGASATGFGQLMPVVEGFSWMDGGLSHATWEGGALLMPHPGQSQVLQLAAWDKDELIRAYENGLLLAEAFGQSPALRLYDLDRGLLLSSLPAPAGDEAPSFHHIALSDQGFAVMADNQYEENRFSLYLWDFSQLAQNQPLPLTRTTLPQLRESHNALARSLAEKHGIALYIRQAGAHFQNDSYYGLPLDQEPALAQALPLIDRLLSRLPQALLEEITAHNQAPLALYLTGGIRPRGEEGLRSPTGLTASGGDAPLIALDIRGAGGALSLAHELMHLLENHLETQSSDASRELMENWLLLCPQEAAERGFHYSYFDQEGWSISDTRYTADDLAHPEDIWFIDAYSRTFPMEDRARVFEHLLLAEDTSPDVFTHPRLLRKAQYLCALLRQGFSSLKDAPTLYWERLIPQLPYEDFEKAFEAQGSP